MSNSDDSISEPSSEVLDPGSDVPVEEASISLRQRRQSTRVASRRGSGTAEADFLIAHLLQQGISSAPGLPLSQLRELSDQVSGAVPQNVPAASVRSPGSPGRGRGHSRGGKRSRKSSPPGARPPKKSTPSQARQPGSTANQPLTDHSLASSLQSLASSMLLIDAHLQSMENISAGASTSAAIRAVFPAPVPPGQVAPHFQVAPSHSLASALPAPPSGRPFISHAANISSRLRSKILEGKDINLVSLILPSPECDKAIATGGNITAVFKAADPRLLKDLSIGQFLVAFGIFRDVYPERRVELDAYMAIIGDLHLKYGRSIFYYYHKSFSSKAALHLAHCNIRLDWSVLDTELLVMATGGQHVITCNSCGAQGHLSPFCPSVPFSGPRGFPTPYAGNDRQNHQAQYSQDEKICSSFNKNVCSHPYCTFLHICSFCKDAHPKSVCPRRSRSFATTSCEKPRGGKMF